ncbi:MAG: phage major capsid protein [Rickettsiales bacterium]|jgi:HK97 family phage major capsid protein|nr:phage major capsid protein [Rickettsiales bacterium]
MDILDLNEKLEKFGNSWEHFKEVNNDRLLQLEKKGSVDPLTEIKLEKLNVLLDEQKSKINSLEVAMSRPVGDGYCSREYKSNDDIQYKNAFDSYLKRGIEEQLASIETKRDLTTSIDTATSYGGYLLTPNIQRMVVDRVESLCAMRKICSVQEISSSSLDVIDCSQMVPSWIGETGAVDDTDSSIFSKKTIATYDLVAQPRVSQKLLDDAAIDIEEWLANRLGSDFAVAEEKAFIGGLGSVANQPRGILDYLGENDGIAVTTSTNLVNPFDENDLLELYYSLGEKYINSASFMMPRSAMKYIRLLKDTTTDHYLWNPALLAGQADTLLGCPIYQSSNMPAVGESTKSILFGDFRYYQIVDRVGIRILRDPFTAKPYVKFYTTKRVGGDVVDVNAFRGLITSAGE